MPEFLSKSVGFVFVGQEETEEGIIEKGNRIFWIVDDEVILNYEKIMKVWGMEEWRWGGMKIWIDSACECF